MHTIQILTSNINIICTRFDLYECTTCPSPYYIHVMPRVDLLDSVHVVHACNCTLSLSVLLDNEILYITEFYMACSSRSNLFPWNCCVCWSREKYLSSEIRLNDVMNYAIIGCLYLEYHCRVLTSD